MNLEQPKPNEADVVWCDILSNAYFGVKPLEVLFPLHSMATHNFQKDHISFERGKVLCRSLNTELLSKDQVPNNDSSTCRTCKHLISKYNLEVLTIKVKVPITKRYIQNN